MSNNFTKAENVIFEEVVEKFDQNSIHSNLANVKQADTKYFTKNGVTERRQAQQMAESSTGRNTTGQTQDVIELTVPVSISDSDMVNATFELNSNEQKEAHHRDRKVDAIVRELSSKMEQKVANKVTQFGSVVLTSTGEFDDYEELARAETEFMNREVGLATPMSMVLNPRAARKASSVLARRESGVDQKSAYEKSFLPPVAGFSTHKANTINAVNARGVASITVGAANQSKTLEAYDSSTNSTADNRYQNLAVSATANVAVGDAFTIAGVNALGMISKNDTGNPQTYRVTKVVDGTTLEITPAIVPLDGTGAGHKQYANVNTAPAAGAVITFVNSAIIQPITFFCNDAVEIFTTGCAESDLSAGMDVMRASTDSGIEILFAKQTDINTLTTQYRMSFMANANVLEPQRVGVMLANQATNVGG